jgi:hypothetical protein
MREKTKKNPAKIISERKGKAGGKRTEKKETEPERQDVLFNDPIPEIPPLNPSYPA